MNGEQGVDHLFGGDQDDHLWGGSDNDHLFGGYGNDYLDVVPREDDPQEIKEYGSEQNYLGIDVIYGGWDADAMQSNVDAEGTECHQCRQQGQQGTGVGIEYLRGHGRAMLAYGRGEREAGAQPEAQPWPYSGSYFSNFITVFHHSLGASARHR